MCTQHQEPLPLFIRDGITVQYSADFVHHGVCVHVTGRLHAPCETQWPRLVLWTSPTAVVSWKKEVVVTLSRTCSTDTCTCTYIHDEVFNLPISFTEPRRYQPLEEPSAGGGLWGAGSTCGGVLLGEGGRWSGASAVSICAASRSSPSEVGVGGHGRNGSQVQGRTPHRCSATGEGKEGRDARREN